MPRRRAWLPPIILAVISIPSAHPTDRHPSPSETRSEFEAVCKRITEGSNPYYGAEPLQRARLRAQDLPPSPLVAAARLGYYAWQLMRVGRPEEALTPLQSAHSLLDKNSDQESIDLLSTLKGLLALAHMQAGEDTNCLEMHNGSSCILPIARDAVHTKPEHARIAGDLLRQLATANPEDVQSRWLLNVSRMTSGDYPSGVPEKLRLPADFDLSIDSRRWQNMAPKLGLDVVDLSGGAVADDFDGDGLIDLLSSSSDPCQPLKAFRNRGSQGFEDVTHRWGLDAQLGGLNLLQADFDNDGRLDLLILRGGWWGRDGRIRNSLLKNELVSGEGSFVDITAAAGLAYPAYPTQTAAWADYDNDGDLDLFVGNESEGTAVYTSKEFMQEIGSSYPSQLFRNNSNGTFSDVARSAGVTNQSFAKSVVWGDIDNDGNMDLFVSNIGPNRLFRNKGDGTFVDLADQLGVTEPEGRSFPSWFFDYNNDGWLDLFVTDYSADMNTVFRSYLGEATEGGHPLLFRNVGSAFEEVSTQVGLTRPLLPMGANYGDLDGDGWPDLFMSTGVPDFEALMINAVYRNVGGAKFADVTLPLGFGHIQKGHGVAFADLDNDGDQDVFHQLGGAYPFDEFANALYINPGSEQHWITLRFVGREANRFAVGGRIEVRIREGETTRSVHSLIGTGGSFGASSLQQEIGLGMAEEIHWIRIQWPGSRKEQQFESVPLDRIYKVIEGDPHLIEIPAVPFELVSATEKHQPH